MAESVRETPPVGLQHGESLYLSPVNVVEGTMSAIDRQRISAVRAMEAAGHIFDGIDWVPPIQPLSAGMDVVAEGDAMHSLLVLRADRLVGCVEGSEGETELRLIAETVSSYEAKRWPDGKVPGGKG
jgi:hypothetical protein